MKFSEETRVSAECKARVVGGLGTCTKKDQSCPKIKTKFLIFCKSYSLWCSAARSIFKYQVSIDFSNGSAFKKTKK